jgi:hypothetical protein
VRVALVAGTCTNNTSRQRELLNAIVRSLAIDGEASGPDPVVKRIGAPPLRANSQMFVAPPRFELWTMPRPSGVKTDRRQHRGGSFDSRREKSTCGSIQSCPATPPRP